MEHTPAWLGRELLGDDEQRHAFAHANGVPFVVLEPADIAKEAMLVIPEPMAREHNAVGFALQGHTLEVALLNLADLEHFGFLESRYRLVPRLTTRGSMVKALLHYQKHLREAYGAQLEAANSPDLLDVLLRHAFMSGASDIHLELGSSLVVRYRIRGILRSAFALPPGAGSNLFGQLRALAGISAGALPKESRLKVDLGNGEDARVSVQSLSTVGGEKMVLHIIRERERAGWTLSSLGLHGEALERVHHFLNRRRGLLLVEGTGPSSNLGAGKTTLLYTLLDLLNTPELALASVEERVSQTLPRVAQVEVGGALSPAALLRGVLKSDPDVVMLDPLQGSEMSALARFAVARGILVLAANEGGAEIEAPELRVHSAVLKKLCSKKFLDKRKLTRQESDALETAGANFAHVLSALKEEGVVAKDTPWKEVQFARAAACSECTGGYEGMLGVQEVQEKGLARRTDTTEGEIVSLNLIEDALFKAAQGLTTIEEVLSLAK